jgi:hypothetical protein
VADITYLQLRQVFAYLLLLTDRYARQMEEKLTEENHFFQDMTGSKRKIATLPKIQLP